MLAELGRAGFSCDSCDLAEVSLPLSFKAMRSAPFDGVSPRRAGTHPTLVSALLALSACRHENVELFGPPDEHALDAGVQDAILPPPGEILPPLPVDAGATIACATDLALCLLADPLQVDQCLDQFSTCDSVFSGDGGREAACDTRLATCLLSTPFEIDECMAERTRCVGEP